MAYSSVQLNSSPSVAIQDCTPLSMITPFFKGHHHPIKPVRLKPFGRQAYVLSHNESKLEPTAKHMILVGLEAGSNVFQLWDQTSRQIVISSDVKFNEHHFSATGHENTPSPTQIELAFLDVLATVPIFESQISSEVNDASMPPTGVATVTNEGETVPLSANDEEVPIQDDSTYQSFPDPIPTDALTPDPPIRRSTRESMAPIRYGFISRDAPMDDNNNPTYEAAMNGPDRLLGKKAMEAEFEAFTEHNVGTLVDKPPNANVLGGMWIFSRKHDEYH